MITDQQTNRLYLSGLLKKRDPELFLKLTSLLDKKGIEYKLLLYTKDIWCRDYMPIQKEKKQFIQYLYTPDYLQNQVAINYQTDPTETLNAMNISTQKCNLPRKDLHKSNACMNCTVHT